MSLAESLASIDQASLLPVVIAEDLTKRDLLQKAIDDEYQLFDDLRSTSEDVGPVVDPMAFGSLRSSMDPVVTHNGEVIRCHLLKDITFEEHQGRTEPGMLGRDAGQALQSYRSELSQFHPSIAAHDNPSSTTGLPGNVVARVIGVIFDLWCIIILHRWWPPTVIFITRKLYILQPLFISSWSAFHAANLTKFDLYDGVFLEGADEGKIREFLDVSVPTSPESLATIGQANFPQCSLAKKEFESVCGRVVIARYLGGAALAVCRHHLGERKYRGQHHRILRSDLSYLCSIKESVVCALIELELRARPIPPHSYDEAGKNVRLDWLNGIRRTANDLFEAAGLDDALLNVTQDLAVWTSFSHLTAKSVTKSSSAVAAISEQDLVALPLATDSTTPNLVPSSVSHTTDAQEGHDDTKDEDEGEAPAEMQLHRHPMDPQQVPSLVWETIAGEPGSEERRLHYDAFITNCRDRIERGLPVDASFVAAGGHEWDSAEFGVWFMERSEGTVLKRTGRGKKVDHVSKLLPASTLQGFSDFLEEDVGPIEE